MLVNPLTRRNNPMNYTVIKVEKHPLGSNCSIVINFKHHTIAHQMVEILNKYYGSHNLMWVVDEYAC